jgi:AraC-like DNA-binding protein
MRAMFENGNTVASGGDIVSSRDAGFASAQIATYRLFGLLEMNMFEIMPYADIRVPYEFECDNFEIAYGVEGSFFIHTNSHGNSVFNANGLYLSPAFNVRGEEAYHRDQVFKTISFNASGSIMDAVMDRLGWGRLWHDAADNSLRGKGASSCVAAAPADISASFLQIAACDYPDRCKLPFFESKFMEIISRFIASELSGRDAPPDAGQLEDSRIKKIPGILMERSDSPPSIPELARDLSMNTTTMKRGFKRIFGEPIYEHHRNMRLELAAANLLDTNKSVFEISMDAGYSDCGNFCRAFKKRYGIPPGQYRRRVAASP